MRVRSQLALLGTVLFATACNRSQPIATAPSSLALPSPSGSPTTPHPSMEFAMGGLVSNDEGVPVPGARMTVLFDPEAPDSQQPSALTDAAGRYAVNFKAVPGSAYVPNRDPAGTEDAVAFGQVEASGYERYARWILGTTQRLIENVRLHRITHITAGTPAMLTIAPDDTLCVLDVWPGRDLICGIVHVVAPTSGTMSIAAVPSQAGSDLPDIEAYGGATGARGNPVLIQVSAGTEYTVLVEVPWGHQVSQSFVLNTSVLTFSSRPHAQASWKSQLIVGIACL
jgi:hypothetical protein